MFLGRGFSYPIALEGALKLKELSYKKRVELDIIYSENISFLLDIKIFIKTIYIILFPYGKGAF